MPTSPEGPQRSGIRLDGLLIAAVCTDLAIGWYRTVSHPGLPALLFRGGETLVKLLILRAVLRERRWGYALQILFAVLAALSGAMLLARPNRASADPLLWLSLAAQLTAGLCAGLHATRAIRAPREEPGGAGSSKR